jgi:phosphatidylinositol-3-phosphatase
MRRSRLILTAVLVGVLLAGSGIGLAAGRGAGAPRRLERVPRFGHVFLLIGENTSLRQDTAKNTPYLVKRLKPRGAWLTNYSAVASGSLADYIAITSGHFKKCEVNDDLPYHLNSGKLFCHERIDNLFHQLDVARVSWLEWNESMPNPCAFFDTGTDWARNVYSTHHNPAVYYDDVEGVRYNEAFNKAPKRECLHKVIATGTTAPNDMGTFNTALAKGHVARFNMVIPNDCEQGHDACGATGCVSSTPS